MKKLKKFSKNKSAGGSPEAFCFAELGGPNHRHNMYSPK